jgi:hypothetical protein
MKKLIALLLALTLLALFVGCDSVKKEDSEEEQKIELSRGTIEGDVYTNEVLNFKFTKPSSWVYSTDEEISAAMNLGVDALGEKFKDALENNTSVYDMMVSDILTRTNINVGYENLAKSFSSNITEAQYIDALKQQMSSVSAATYTFSDQIDTAKLGAHEYTRSQCTVSVSGMEMTQVYYLRKIDSVMGFVIVTIVDGYTISEIEAMFS